jgi:hypothetical protein
VLQAFLDAAKPYSALLLVHNGGNHANQRLAAIHPRLHFAALAPHVANTAQQALQLHCHWAMATWQYKPKVGEGEVARGGGVLRGTGGIWSSCALVGPSRRAKEIV